MISMKCQDNYLGSDTASECLCTHGGCWGLEIRVPAAQTCLLFAVRGPTVLSLSYLYSPPHTVTSAEELLKDFMSNLGFSEGAWKHNSGYYPTVIERNYLATTHLPSSVLSAEHYPPVMLTPLQCSRFSGDWLNNYIVDK